MMCLSILPTALLGIVITATQPYVIAANKQADVYRLAKKSTILVDGQNPGSGVIIGKQGNSYFVLTAEHVVETEDEYEIVTPDGSRYRLDYSSVRRLPNIDLAIVSFISNKNYPQAKLGNSDNVTEGDKVFIAGWPAPGKALPHVYQITSGEISGICPRPVARGYRLIYTNVTRAGMSGGPIFNEGGEVIGIHGLAEGREVYQSGYEEYPIKTGFNLGIPINTFSRAAKQVDTNIAQLPSSPSTPQQTVAKSTHLPATSKAPPASLQTTAKPAQLPAATPKAPPAPLQTTTKPAQLPATPKAPPAPLQTTAKPAQLPATTPKAPPAPLQTTAKPAQLPATTPKAPPAPLQTTAKPAQLPATTPKAPPVPLQTTAKPAQLPATTPKAPPVPLQTTAKPAQLPATTPKAPPAPLQITAKPAQLPTSPISPTTQPKSTTKLAELLDAPKIPSKNRGPQISFAQAPRLVRSQSTSKNAKELGATYYFTIDVPASANLPLQQINLTLKQGVEYPRFKARAVNAFEGTPRNKGTELPLGLIVTDPPTRTLTVVFDSPVVPGKGVTIAVRPVRNPSVGTYQFEATAFPEGDTAKGQFAGIGRFDFYRSSK
ncbi:DUF2808 domain-containing protein [Acaryochloris marina]|uniref:DUF2808 domain-containing protein n=1 Tax=Acaryochloris marina TaxID=155978 RepID=UPI001BB02708|nr:DUF2808 domain-containing protein [Acaryochloris marina]QUY44040.1 DUF2808 domain-containing protein [Acaryochloris marina S15]